MMAVFVTTSYGSLAHGQWSKIDIPWNGLIIDAAAYAGPGGTGPLAYANDVLAPWLDAGRNGGAWNGVGLTSSYVSDVDASYGREYLAVGMVINSELNDRYGYYYQSFGGRDLSTQLDPNPFSYIFLKTTYVGDTNLDGVVDAYDTDNLNLNYGQLVLSPGLAWMVGDFNHDAITDSTDATALSQNLGTTLVYPPKPELYITKNAWGTVPEPGAFALLGAASIVCCGAKWRRRRSLIVRA
jgi:hypothetical protein